VVSATAKHDLQVDAITTTAMDVESYRAVTKLLVS